MSLCIWYLILWNFQFTSEMNYCQYMSNMVYFDRDTLALVGSPIWFILTETLWPLLAVRLSQSWKHFAFSLASISCQDLCNGTYVYLTALNGRILSGSRTVSCFFHFLSCTGYVYICYKPYYKSTYVSSQASQCHCIQYTCRPTCTCTCVWYVGGGGVPFWEYCGIDKD